MAEKEKVEETAVKTGSDWYENARREWNERYGDYIASARAWRRTAIAAMLVAAIAVGGIVWIGAQSKLVPYIVEINKQGVALAAQPAEQANNVQDQTRIVKAVLARWIVDLRTVTPDVNLEKSALSEVYAHLNRNDPAEAEVNGFFSKNNPILIHLILIFLRTSLAFFTFETLIYVRRNPQLDLLPEVPASSRALFFRRLRFRRCRYFSLHIFCFFRRCCCFLVRFGLYHSPIRHYPITPAWRYLGADIEDPVLEIEDLSPVYGGRSGYKDQHIPRLDNLLRCVVFNRRRKPRALIGR